VFVNGFVPLAFFVKVGRVVFRRFNVAAAAAVNGNVEVRPRKPVFFGKYPVQGF
jgi:hypothetical protein